MTRTTILFNALVVGLLIFALCLIAAGCELPASAEEATPSSPVSAPPSLLPEASPSAAPSDADLSFEAYVAFGHVFYLNYDQYDTEQDIETVPELMELRYLFTGMADDYDAAVKAGANAALAKVREYDPDAALNLSAPVSDWRFMVALCSECSEKPEKKLIRLSNIETIYADGVLNVTVTLPGFEEFFANESDDVQYNALTIYCYLNTVYNSDGSETYSDGTYSFPEGYVDGLVEPLPKRNIKEGWYNDRSDGTRRHMGTDITAPVGRIIHSCSDGTVLYIGWTDVAGNYVMIEDDLGFRYTYCHMVEPTTHVKVGDRVAAGDVIGNVGSTGNSDAPHLHLSIIVPEYRYVDPYPLVAAIRQRTNG